MSTLSERWFRLVEKGSTVVFSFIVFWGTLFSLNGIDTKITHYLNHLSDKTGNGAYSAIYTLYTIVCLIVIYILFVMPFGMVRIILRGDKIGDNKQYILRFPLQFLLFLLRIVSRV